jgi:hypothetical protein
VFAPLITAIASLLAALLGLRWFMRADPARLAVLLRKGGAALAGLFALLLLMTGRFFLGVVAAGFAWALWTDRLPFRAAIPGLSGGKPGRTTTVRTAFLEMTLDHTSRAINGRVTAGRFAGSALSALSQRELLQLLAECRAGESQSRQVLEAYLDRVWPEWHDAVRQPSGGTGAKDAGAKDARQDGKTASNGSSPSGGASSAMTRDEALQVLGLTSDTSSDAIRTAHRNLMKRFHPDQGGSTYLAAKINEAKDVLLGR